MISVIIPTYNRANYLKEAIDSVLSQTFKDYEIIVVDDASRDNTKEIVLSFQDKVRYIYQDNKERGAARNNGIRNAKGEFIAFLDSDDIWLPDHLKNCLDALIKNKNAGLSFSHSYIINENGKVISKKKPYRVNGFMLKKIVSNFSSFGCNASSCVIKKNIFKQSGYFNEDRTLSGSEDWEMWVRIANHVRFISTNSYTVKIRLHSENSSTLPDKMAKSMKKALDTVYENNDLLLKIKEIKNHAYSSLYVLTAINYYASGKMVTSRHHLNKALQIYPASILINKNLIYTYLRSLLGPKLPIYIRKSKWLLYSKLFNPK